MRKETFIQILGVGAVALGLLLGISMIANERTAEHDRTARPAQVQSVTISIEGLYANKEVRLSLPTTVLGLLQQLNAENESMRLKTKEYSGLGILVEGISDRINGTSSEYWQYKVNGTMPQVGADKLEVANGDVIEWYFEASEF